ncbi:MAG: hypothetical protein AELANPGJ_01786 [Anaerolineae bacterium]|nr:hypothetical protein [Anaerolineae bacterium]
MRADKTVVAITALMVLLMSAACQSNGSLGQELPTLIVLPTLSPSPAPTAFPTRDIRPLPTAVPTAASTPAPLIVPTDTPSPAPSPESTPAATTLPDRFVFGQSVEGRDLIGYRIGSGERVLMLVGAVHGGFEQHTSDLIEQLADHYRSTPADVLPQVSLVLIPALNPDGLARGRVLAGRLNANGVDLNRNWPCGWSPNAVFRDQPVGAGAEPLDQPETRALAALIEDLQPGAVLFFHAAAAGVFAGDCGGDAGSAAMSAVFGAAASYAYGSDFSDYVVTGTGPAWVNSIGIPSADVELTSATDPEFDRNLAGVQAVQCWLAPMSPACA